MTSYHCQEFTIDKYNELISHFNCFSLLNINIQSLSKNYDNLNCFLATFNKQFNIIGLTEIWLQSSLQASFYNNSGYSFECSLRDNSRYGGVGIYIKNTISYSIISYNILSGAESIWLKITVETVDIIIGVIYRKPDSDVNDFLHSLDDAFHTLHIDINTCILMGDFNIDIKCNNLTAA